MTPRDGIERDPYAEPHSWTYPATGRPAAERTSRPANQDPHAGHGAHGGHGLMMLICCVPMLVIAVALVATGVVGSSIIVTALLCTAMMAAMMFAMPGGHGHK